jgi:hypothetical protein
MSSPIQALYGETSLEEVRTFHGIYINNNCVMADIYDIIRVVLKIKMYLEKIPFSYDLPGTDG